MSRTRDWVVSSNIHWVLFLISCLFIYNYSLLIIIPQLPEFSPPYNFVIRIFLSHIIGMAVISIIYGWYKGNTGHLFEIQWSPTRDIAYSVIGTLSLFGINIVAAIIAVTLGISTATNQTTNIITSNPEYGFVYFLVAVFFVGVGEELFFRGAIQRTFREEHSENISILATGLIFGTLHIASFSGGNIVGFSYTVGVISIIAFFLGWLYERTDNILVPIIAHGIYDGILFLLLTASTEM